MKIPFLYNVGNDSRMREHETGSKVKVCIGCNVLII